MDSIVYKRSFSQRIVGESSLYENSLVTVSIEILKYWLLHEMKQCASAIHESTFDQEYDVVVMSSGDDDMTIKFHGQADV